MTVLVDTDNVNAQMMQDKGKLADALRQNQELTAEVERLNKEMEQLLSLYRWRIYVTLCVNILHKERL